MGGKRRLKGDVVRVLGRHDGAEGVQYRRVYAALTQELAIGPNRPALRLQAGQVAALWVTFWAATATLGEARRRQRDGKGRRPSPEQIGRLQHRQLAANSAYQVALEALREGASPWK
jgi:hypothetical protein